uniref:Arogenate dehydratase n=2 Tax=Oryza punctata TaxID=4537 RepID=A0A0E0LQ62_ORYPU
MEASGDGLKVAYQGCPGAYSEAAAKKAYPSCHTVPCEYFETAFQAVENWVADRAVLPLENSLGGSIHRNYDLLLRHRLHIVGEVRLAVRHCLLANPGVKIQNLRSAMSHPQGCPGAYSEAAAKKAYPSCHTVPCEYFETAFQAVENWVADRAVLPLENSLGGSIHRNYDLLLRHRLHIVGEVRLAVRHCLLANPGVKIQNLRSAMSHPQALAQCEQTLTKLGIEHREAVDDTAGAAKLIAEQKLQDTGAVASSLAAQLYGLDILAENIQDDTDNVTRFMMLAREPIIPRTDKPFKTSIVFSLEEGPGQLFKALAVFALRKINLTKMESRPHKKKPLRIADDNCSAPLKHFDYLFYVDLEASMADPNAQNALANLKEFATFLRVLGSYPTDVSEA